MSLNNLLFVFKEQVSKEKVFCSSADILVLVHFRFLPIVTTASATGDLEPLLSVFFQGGTTLASKSTRTPFV